MALFPFSLLTELFLSVTAYIIVPLCAAILEISNGHIFARLIRTSYVARIIFAIAQLSDMLEMCMGMGKTGIPLVPWDSLMGMGIRPAVGWEWDMNENNVHGNGN